MAHYMDTIRELACDELEKLAQKGKIADRGDAQLIDWLTHTIKSIDAIEAMEEDGYSERGYSYNYRDGDYSEARGRGRNQRRDSMGRYSREGRGGGRGGNSYRGYSREGYSRGDMVEHLQDMMENARTEQERETIRRWMAEAEKD